jgi:hypothetical protein
MVQNRKRQGQSPCPTVHQPAPEFFSRRRVFLAPEFFCGAGIFAAPEFHAAPEFFCGTTFFYKFYKKSLTPEKFRLQ